MGLRLATVATLLLVALAPRTGWAGALTLTLAPGFDSNPSRTVGEEARPDAYLGLSGSARGRLALGAWGQVQGRYDLGLRKYLVQAGEDLAVQQGELELSGALGPLVLGAEVSAKLRLSRAGTRDYLDAGGELFADLAPARWLSVRGAVGVRGFVYLPEAAYDFAGPRGLLALRLQPARRHVATLAAFAAMPLFHGAARYDATGVLSPDSRRDRHLGLQLAYSYRGPLAVQGGYTFLRVDSNSFGEGSERHRVWAALSAKLPWRLFAGVQAAWQFIRYPDGVFLSEDLLLLDDESQSSLGAKVSFAATGSLDVELRYSAYWIELPPARESEETAGTTWWRHTATLGVALRL